MIQGVPDVMPGAFISKKRSKILDLDDDMEIDMGLDGFEDTDTDDQLSFKTAVSVTEDGYDTDVSDTSGPQGDFENESSDKQVSPIF